MSVNDAIELLSGLWEKLSGSWWVLVPAFSAISSGYHYFRKRTVFQSIFGFPWPRSDREREMTAQVVEHKLSMLRWQAEQSEQHPEIKNAVRDLEKAEELLASAGYGEYIEGLPEENEDDDDEDDEEDTDDDETDDNDKDETGEEEDKAHA